MSLGSEKHGVKVPVCENCKSTVTENWKKWFDTKCQATGNRPRKLTLSLKGVMRTVARARVRSSPRPSRLHDSIAYWN